MFKLADELEKAAKILRTQAEAKNRLWMGSIIRRKIGQDVSLMVGDVRRYESSRRNRDNTWGKEGDSEANRRVANTMGFDDSV